MQLPPEQPLTGRPLRIAHVAAQLDTGGLERLLVEHARHIDRTRFHLHFISLGHRGPIADDLESCGWLVTTMDRPDGIHPSVVLRLANLFRRWGADLIHTHNMRPLIYGAPAGRVAGARVIYTRHGQHYAARPRDRARLRVATRLVDYVVSVSEDSTRLAEDLGIAPTKLRTIPNGIDLARFPYTGPNPAGPAAMVGRLSPEKDPHTLVHSAAIACAAEPSLRLEIAGTGRCMDSLVELTRSLGLQERIKFHGDVRDVPSLLARASQYVLPSLSEGISLSLLEAMATGLPVVATRVGGTPEVVDHERNGLLVPAESPSKLAAAMLRLHRDPTAARQMGTAAHEHVRRHFDVRRMVADYEKLYERCARPRLPRARAA